MSFSGQASLFVSFHEEVRPACLLAMPRVDTAYPLVTFLRVLIERRIRKHAVRTVVRLYVRSCRATYSSTREAENSTYNSFCIARGTYLKGEVEIGNCVNCSRDLPLGPIWWKNKIYVQM